MTLVNFFKSSQFILAMCVCIWRCVSVSALVCICYNHWILGLYFCVLKLLYGTEVSLLTNWCDRTVTTRNWAIQSLLAESKTSTCTHQFCPCRRHVMGNKYTIAWKSTVPQWRRRRGQGGLVPPTFQRGGAEPPHFRAFLTSHAMNKFINASKEAMHLPVVQKQVAVAACESFTTRNRSKLHIRPFSGTKNHEH